MNRRMWIVSELYYPEQSATGYYLTGIAEGLAMDGVVHVLCGQPTYSSRGVRAPVQEVRNGVSIHRCRSTTFDKDRLAERFVNLVTISLSIFVQALLRFRPNDRVLVVTNPPTLPFLISVACRVRKAECIPLIHDVFPEALVVSGIAGPDSLLVQLLHWLNRLLFQWVRHVVVIGRDMEELMRHKIGNDLPSLSVIPNWADVDKIVPRPREENPFLRQWNVREKFVVQSSGNMARTTSIETMVQGAELLKDRNDIHFVFVGSGVKKPWLELTIRSRALDGVSIIPPQPRESLCDLLNAADIALVGMIPGMKGVSVPSRVYNILAAGKPIIALSEPNSELARIVMEDSVGWVVDPSDPQMLAKTIVEASRDLETLVLMGRRARVAAEQKYRFNKSLESFRTLMHLEKSNGN